MLPDTLANLKQQLLDQLDDVSDEIGAHSDPETLRNSDVESAIVNSDDALIKKIEFALKRIEDGSYGKCTGCEGQIPVARLKAKPSVSLCTSCQEEKERQQS